MTGACRRRLVAAAYWLSPPAACVALYWLGLKCWFWQDDFAWLHLKLEIHDWRDLLRLLFEPRAQGTIRPLSERLFFIVFHALFGLDPLPFRIWVFLTQFANLTLLSALARRLSGSRLAGWASAMLWLAGSGLARVMTWTSAYNQALCAFFLLAAFYALVRHGETGERGWWRWQWAAYLAGFGALEWMVVYPPLATAYALLCRPGLRWRVAWLWPPAVVFVAVHQWATPGAPQGLYGLYFDVHLPLSLLTYWAWALSHAYARGTALLVAIVLSAAVLGFAVERWRRRDRLPAFLAGWFVLVIAPVLPLRYHQMDYYLTMPTLGTAMLGGYALSRALQAGWAWKALSLVLAGAYLGTALPATREATEWNYYRSRAVGGMVRGVARANQLHPGKTILLVGVDSGLFWTGVFDQPFRLVGRNSVFLAPGSEKQIERHPEFGDIERFILPPGPALRALEEGRLVVYAVEQDRLRNITKVYEPLARSRWRADEPRYVDVAELIFAPQLGTGWYEIQGSHRWMGRRASLWLGGPAAAGQRLHLEGFCPAQRLSDGPIRLSLKAAGIPVGTVVLDKPGLFRRELELPAQLVGRPRIEIVLEVDRTLRVEGDSRELGLVFGRFAIR
ncbi:MAG: hypothetical protein RMI94_06090 [Bryobacterales bacterium]|nr:glycosyltransferase family 39 protein [Bryobacteraceae bacterium]MDW8130099.1 hypothetical protein [Bryobacterales bacterium]